MAKAEALVSPAQALAWSRFLGVRGRFEWQDKKNDQAVATFKMMYDYCSANKLYERAIDAAHMVAIAGDPQMQVEWSLKGIKEAEAGNITGWLGPLWNNLGATYEEMGKYKESLEAYLKAREYHWRHSDEKAKLIADWAVGHAYRLNGDFKTAAQWLRPVLAWCERINDIEFWGFSYKELAEIEFTQGNKQIALRYYSEAAEKLRQADMPNWDPEGYKKLTDKINELKSDSH